MSKKRTENCCCGHGQARSGHKQEKYRKPTLLFGSESDRRRYARNFPSEYAEMGKEVE